MPAEIRLAVRTSIQVCEGGHVVAVADERELVAEVPCQRCGGWTWADQPFCTCCGARR